ncbi:MAG: 30S ribosomal protein S12 methylthiotransferase RimO [Planctomycetes bacterium]|nr:30S ribosomal protein S12 methylthiotransferase RimO [Planctomycetota bacterium]
MANKPKVSFVSLGCPKNLVDSETILGKLLSAGSVLCEDPQDSDVVIINTCCFIKEAEDESAKVINDAIKLKQDGFCKAVIVAGCMASRYGKALKSRFPDVDAVAGVWDKDSIVSACFSLHSREKNASSCNSPTPETMPADSARLRLTPRHFAYIKIADGCNNKCSYCIIPGIRGSYKSKPLNAIAAEAGELVRDGVVEACLIAQDTTMYGANLDAPADIVDAMAAACKADFKWVRLLYAHPAHFNDKLIGFIAENKKAVKYIDLPVQHISANMLDKMNRHVSPEQVRKLIEKMRKNIKGLFIRTSIIVGFPGETEKDFGELLEFLKEYRFERLGAFAYSREKGTRAYHFPGHLSEGEKNRRLDAVMKLQQEIAFEQNKGLIGSVVDAIVDAKENGMYKCRTYGDAPEVDGTLFVKINKKNKLAPGDVFSAKITGFKEYDLTGEIYG